MSNMLARLDRDDLLGAFELGRTYTDESKRWPVKQRRKYETMMGFLVRVLGGRGEWPPRTGPEPDDDDVQPVIVNDLGDRGAERLPPP